jgi:hypothetical protein
VLAKRPCNVIMSAAWGTAKQVLTIQELTTR